MQRAASGVQHATHEHATYGIQRATSQRNMDYPTGRKDRWRTTCNMQHATFTTKMQHVRTPWNTKHTCTVRSTRCNMHHTQGHVQRCRYNACNYQQQGLRTALDHAMLPPLNVTNPPSIATTPPPCTPLPHSASDTTGLRRHAHLSSGRIGDRHRLKRRTAAGHV